eukprot:354145-Chlamydomonas_euryale.AAC.3
MKRGNPRQRSFNPGGGEGVGVARRPDVHGTACCRNPSESGGGGRSGGSQMPWKPQATRPEHARQPPFPSLPSRRPAPPPGGGGMGMGWCACSLSGRAPAGDCAGDFNPAVDGARDLRPQPGAVPS